MENIKFPQLPFLTREMLTFGSKSSISLRIKARSVSVREVTINGATREGQFSYVHPTPGSAGSNSQDFRIPDVPTFVSVIGNASNIEQGEQYIELSLLINGVEVQQLCSGYVYGVHGISFPQTNLADKRPGGGLVRVITVDDPAAGADLTQTVTDEQYWRIQAIQFRLVTDANMANRRVHIIIDDETDVVMELFGTENQGTGLTRNYSIIPVGAIPDEIDGTSIIIALPQNLILPNPFRIRTATSLIQVGDQFSLIRILVESFFS